MFWGVVDDKTVGANKNVIKIVGQNTDLKVQGYFASPGMNLADSRCPTSVLDLRRSSRVISSAAQITWPYTELITCMTSTLLRI
ncbi:MAG: uncharacterized protein KVP18_002563 [Porospora cf. gigantea A]|uniref:uncharacterized protein n=1 Tax=Porospora cf. gigantea A TaxID=2853593 RepID=UPI00355A2A94|nr:MAG: hypothetical protein KVP18_002563 [Porospora cf. gigantea A]